MYRTEFVSHGFEMSFTKNEKIWSVRYEDTPQAREAVLRLSGELGVSEVCARLIYNRGYRTTGEAISFLEVGIDSLHDPYLMKDMSLGVERICSAVESGERITVYGDYDVDGVTSVSLIYLYLKSLGACVDYYIPSRNKEGYGVSVSAIDRLHEAGTTLMVTVDTGITANAEVEYASSLGIDTVVTDHHECYASLPPAVAVINPHRPDCSYPFAELAGVGVVFKLVCAMEQRLHPELDTLRCAERICAEYIDLVAIGTVADVMPIRDENRFIVSRGIKAISESKRCGLVALIDAMNDQSSTQPIASQASHAHHAPKKRRINTGFIGFGIAPRINAAGRISSASKAVELLLCEDREVAYERAIELCEINHCRQIEENRIAEQAYKMIDQSHDFERDRIIILDDDSWQQGIIGIVSSRVTEKYGLPSILISYEGATRGFASPDDIGKGSGRSIKGINLVDALGSCEDLLERFGGHELAAGLSLRRGNVQLFRERINEYAREKLGDERITARIEADCEITAAQATMELAIEIERLEPFGVSNATPTFLIKGLEVERIVPLGAGKHSKIIFGGEASGAAAVCFGTPASKLDVCRGERVDILCQLNINEFRGTKTLQFLLSDIRLSEQTQKELEDGRSRYAAICEGEHFAGDEDIIPDRAEIADVFRLLRGEATSGRCAYSDRLLISTLSSCYHRYVGYAKLRFILDIIRDMRVMEIHEVSDGIFEFSTVENAQRTTIESTPTYRRLVSQCENRNT